MLEAVVRVRALSDCTFLPRMPTEYLPFLKGINATSVCGRAEGHANA